MSATPPVAAVTAASRGIGAACARELGGARLPADFAGPLGAAGTAEEVARAAAFLVSSDASYVTGASLLVDGGLVRPV